MWSCLGPCPQGPPYIKVTTESDVHKVQAQGPRSASGGKPLGQDHRPGNGEAQAAPECQGDGKNLQQCHPSPDAGPGPARTCSSCPGLQGGLAGTACSIEPREPGTSAPPGLVWQELFGHSCNLPAASLHSQVPRNVSLPHCKLKGVCSAAWLLPTLSACSNL